ncbi:DMT family transporter [Streptomyces pathocidini]|uniref:DMT family transporter n=1 Tax=Streptomyces pathocidini TaxID=1650571 RepID=UPI0033C9CDFA
MLPVLLSLVSAVCYAAAAILQERVAAATPNLRLALLRDPAWWAAVALNGAGAVLHVVALGSGPLTVVQPLGVLTIVFVLPLAALFARRPVTRAGRRGALMVAAGLAVLMLLTASGPARPLSAGEQSAVAATAAGVVAALALAGRWSGRPAARSLALAAAAGVSYGMASVFVKTVADGWAPASIAASVTADLPALAAIALFAVAGLATSQASYQGAGLTAPLATVTVANPVVASAVGIALLGEGVRYGATGAVAALAAGALTARGLVVLTADSADPHGSSQPGSPDRAKDVRRAQPTHTWCVDQIPGP